jgi:hypothetical protein
MDAAVRQAVRLTLGALAVLGAAVVLLLVGAGSASAADDSTSSPSSDDPGLVKLVGDVGSTLGDTVDQTLDHAVRTPVRDTVDVVVKPTVEAVRDSVDQVVRQPDPQPSAEPQPESTAPESATPPPSTSAPTSGRHHTPRPSHHLSTTAPVTDPAPRVVTDGVAVPASPMKQHDVRGATTDNVLPLPSLPSTPKDHHPADGQGSVPTISSIAGPSAADVASAGLPADPWFGGRTPLRDTHATTQHHTRPDVSPG